MTVGHFYENGTILLYPPVTSYGEPTNYLASGPDF